MSDRPTPEAKPLFEGTLLDLEAWLNDAWSTDMLQRVVVFAIDDPSDRVQELWRPPWAGGDMPDPDLFQCSELFVAGALSTLPPFDHYHPAWALPFARQALDALGEWDPVDDCGGGVPSGDLAEDGTDE